MANIGLPQDPVPWRTERVSVYVTREVAFDFDKITKVTKNVLGKLGCENCHSGRILDIIIMKDFVVNPKTLEVNEMAEGGVVIHG